MIDGQTKENLRALYVQIEKVCNYFKELRNEASSIAEVTRKPNAALHLNDVLQSTEQSAMVIIDAASAIGTLAEDKAVPAEVRQKIGEQISRIYEATNFQDVSGQRIARVLAHLSGLDAQLQHLSEIALGQQTTKPVIKDPFLDGPQLATEAPSQDDVDQLFKSGN